MRYDPLYYLLSNQFTLLPKLSGKRANADNCLHREFSMLNVGANTGILFI